jgi:membrane-associated phospholipid phosphatase
MVIMVVFVCLLAGMRHAVVLRIAFTALVSFALAEAIKASLKIAFGRTWPETWVDSNPSYINDGKYGFFPFHGGPGYASFPSGHMTAAAAVMTVAWFMLPRGRVAWAIVMVLSAAGLVAMNYHFVSDVIAGFFLGSGVAVMVVVLTRHLLAGFGTDRET